MDDTKITGRPIIAITGSAGKTTTKEMIASILQNRWKTFKSFENGNDVWFTSQYAKQLDPSYNAVVLEYGMRYSGDITKHCNLIQPNIGIITNVGSAHIGNFNDQGIDGIATAKSELILNIKPPGMLLLNGDDINSKLLNIKGFKGEIITVGFTKEANYYASQIAYTKTGMIFQVPINGIDYTYKIPVFGKHNVYNALFAIALAHRLGFTFNEIMVGLETYGKNYPDYYKLDVQRFKDEITLISYTYDAKPSAVKAAIDVLVNIGEGKTIAFLGDMVELGNYSIEEHKKVGRYLAAQKNINYLYTFGKDGKYIGQEAVESGFPNDNVVNISSIDQFVNTIKESLTPKTTLLLMGFIYDKESNQIELYETVKYICSILSK
ncbi:UDP-N-acetylmuramoyl-tripeptide--D-alanyl-D-alanine ligase [Cytobacillus dafuensis]|uniref:UDP-N-acetylmuramoyl-tripeptide--D-alanyl-D-alanine ligase n=1 Tax=Cytobacillus dafuensis TaxID=1742359 RepID=A0A5B8Z9V8_CYTDA|nr:UDP-N-acetylmuramoyl-tripeptide--D-alanyl-D-alanine ligase [Cytobacillus dafuensis]QED49915.1 UDP-N-acetylmuramoyl-tripeptide--D-alanyl-D-alanine ligase [Cytobacillus dafuensis]